MTIDSSNSLLDPTADRRDFLRTAGLAAASVGALALFDTPAMAASRRAVKAGGDMEILQVALALEVVGRKQGGVPGYAYSPALKKLTGVWTPARLNLWLQNPTKFAPGTKMYLSVPDAGQRAKIIAYLQSVSTPAPKR